MVSFSSLLPVTPFLFIGYARAVNDWKTPCLSGQCSYDVKNGPATGSVLISGSSAAISDITTAAGWTILNCNATAADQDIRAVCTGDSADCDHLYQGGAVGTLVRLPQNCGAMPFARVAREWTHENQTIPKNVKRMMRKRATDSSVRGIRLDTNFAAVDPAQNGNVSLLIQGSTADGANGNFTVTPAASRRGFLGDIANDVKGAVDDALSALSINVTKSKTQTLDVDKPFTLFDQSVSCPASGLTPNLHGEIKVAVDAKAHAVVGYGVVAAGSLVPPHISDFGLFASLDGTLNGVLTVNASATASFDTGKIQVFQVGIPGLDFPGILSIGPSFVVNAQGTGTLDTELNMAVDLAYSVNGANLFFPPKKGSSSGDFKPADTSLNLSVAPNVAATGSLEAHIIPTIQFGIDALDGVGKATINLDLDSSAKLALSLKGGASATTRRSASGGLSGCLDVSAGLAVNAGADASFFNLFDKSTNVSLFKKSFDVFNKCFDTSSKRHMYGRRHPRDVLVRRGLSCPTASAASLSSVADQVVSSSR
ncbi:hypothetical protein BDW22DRAFT_1333399 [Trametopsis cervina]|nr:hypothetical protein BDW22DRAFT_1333399 [Trametopsis cervina]